MRKELLEEATAAVRPGTADAEMHNEQTDEDVELLLQENEQLTKEAAILRQLHAKRADGAGAGAESNVPDPERALGDIQKRLAEIQEARSALKRRKVDADIAATQIPVGRGTPSRVRDGRSREGHSRSRSRDV